jgi:PAS domain S-box-containing protein
VQFGTGTVFLRSRLSLVQSLRGLTTRFGFLDNEFLNESAIEQRFIDQSNTALALVECLYWVRKLQARFFSGDYVDALQASAKAQRLLWLSLAIIENAEYQFYSALAHAAICDNLLTADRNGHLSALDGHHRQLQIWAENCPENFADRAALVGAEIARLAGDDIKAEKLYERAIHAAHAQGFIHNEALANELAARFYRARGFDKIANLYLRDARELYLQWGADGKVRQLDESHVLLGIEIGSRGSSTAGTIGAPVEHLDLATVIKVSQAVSGEIVLENLVDTLMRTAIEQAGAQRGLLILLRENEAIIEAEATIGGETLDVHLVGTPVTATALPESLLNYVLRTNETVVVENAIVEPSIASDPYIRQHEARSILLLPLMNQTRLIGVLYLENNLAPHVFAAKRMTVLKLIASQAAVSLENTTLYGALAEREAKIRRLVEANIVGIVMWEKGGIAVEANDGFLQMLGFDRDDLAHGRIGSETINLPEYGERCDEASAELKRTGITRPYEKELTRKDGSHVPVLFGAAAFDDHGEKGVGFLIDLTERKQAEEVARESERRLHDMQIELAHVNRVVTAGQLSASIAHEINQPLAGIVMNASTSLRMLGSDPPNIEGARETARRTLRDANRAADVITRLRALFTKKPLPTDTVDINEIVEEVIVLLLNELQRNEVRLSVDLEEGLAAVVGDRVQLQQVVLNLFRNASDAMSAVVDRSRRLLIRTTRDGAQGIVVTVEDSGPGIDPTSLGRIFDAFYSTKPGGLGIGLSICRTIIEAHGGKLSAVAGVTQGAVLQFTLPTKTDTTT